MDSFKESSIFVITPPVNKTARHLVIELVLNDRSHIANQTFEYRSNPVFTDIKPLNHLAL